MPQRQRLRQSCGQASLWQKSQSTKPPLLPGQEQTDGGVMKSVWPRNASGPHESVASSITRRLGGGVPRPAPGPLLLGISALAPSGTGHSTPAGPVYSLSPDPVPRTEEAVCVVGVAGSLPWGLLAHLEAPGIQMRWQHVALWGHAGDSLCKCPQQ